MDGRTFSRGWPDLFKNKPGLFRMEYSLYIIFYTGILHLWLITP